MVNGCSMYICTIIHDFYFLPYALLLTRLIIEDDGLIPMLYALISGLIALALLLTFSSSKKPPRWHKALCAVGFIVAIGWISTIADEVVGILRAFGAIGGVSEAILGVTVFAMVSSHPKNSHKREILYRILWPM